MCFYAYVFFGLGHTPTLTHGRHHVYKQRVYVRVCGVATCKNADACTPVLEIVFEYLSRGSWP